MSRLHEKLNKLGLLRQDCLALHRLSESFILFLCKPSYVSLELAQCVLILQRASTYIRP